MPYIDQAKWFLNGFWKDVAEKEAENVWKYTQKFIELDKKKKNGCELEEFLSHKFLESLGETLTVVALRAKLRQIDLDANGQMALLEYLVFRYSKTVRAAVNNPQGGGPEYDKQMAAAAKLLDELSAALAELQTQKEVLKKAEAAQRKALAEQNKALDEQRIATAAVKKAEDAARVSLNDLHAQQKAYDDKCNSLDSSAKDEKLSQMKRSMAANELAQLKSKDPLPLNAAKIKQAAAVKRVEADRKKADEATAKCAARARELEEQTKVAEAQTRKVEADEVDTEAKVAKANAALDDLKKQGGVAHGAIWWMQREVYEAQKFLPQSKQTMKKM